MTVTTIRPDELVEILSADFINGAVPIQQTTLTGSQASITFSSIPDDFRTLMFINQMETDRAANDFDFVLMRFNGDAGNNYDRMVFTLIGNNTTTATSNIATSSLLAGAAEAATSRNTKAVSVLFMPGYKKTDREKQWVGIGSHIGNVSAITDFLFEALIGNWRNTVAITSVTFLPNAGANFVTGTISALYGIL